MYDILCGCGGSGIKIDAKYRNGSPFWINRKQFSTHAQAIKCIGLFALTYKHYRALTF